MRLIDELKRRIKEAIKAKQTVEKEVLRVALGEIQTIEARPDAKGGDEVALGVIRKLVKSNQETLGVCEDAEQRRVLEEELTVLRALLPKTLNVDQILEALSPATDQIKAAGNDGQAMGVAMKHLKASGAAVESKDVIQAVRRLRSRGD
jgi:uncharacterized protein YqeY